MRRFTTLTTLAAAGVLVAGSATAVTGVTGVSGPQRAAPTPVTTQIVYDEPFTGGHGHFIDLAKKGLGAGDMFLGVGLPLLDHETGDRIGTMDATEIIVSGRHDGTVEMNETLRLKGGLVMISGVVRHTDTPFRMAVVGGTGAYADARGQVTQLKEDRHRNVTVIQLDLIQ
jgi:hypothetical protein